MEKLVRVCNLFDYELYDIKLSSIKSGREDSDDFKKKLVNKIYVGDISDDYLNKCRFFKISMLNCKRLEVAEYLKNYRRANLNGIKETRDLNNLKENDVIVFVDCCRLGKSLLNRDDFEGKLTTKFINTKMEAMDFFVIFINYISTYNFENEYLSPEISHFLNLCISDKDIKSLIDSCVDNYGGHETSKELMEGYTRDRMTCADMSMREQADFLCRYIQSFTADVCKKLKEESEKYILTIEPDVINTGDHVRFTVNDEQFVLDPGIFDLDSECSEGTELIYLKSGSFGDVYRYQTGDEKGTSVIIKRDKKKKKGSRLKTPGWYREYVHTLNLDHTNIMKFWRKPFKYGNYYYGIMQDGGSSLEDIYLGGRSGRQNDPPILDSKEFCSIVQQIAEGIDYLHTYDEKTTKIHGDIRSANITMNMDGVCMLIDFGLATEREIHNERSKSITSEVDNKGNCRWKPPEAMSEQYYKKSRTFDIWSFGIVCLELLAFPERPEFFNKSDSQLCYILQKQAKFQNDVINFETNNRFKTWKDCNENVKSEIKEIIELSCEWQKNKRKENWKTILEKCNKINCQTTLYYCTLERNTVIWDNNKYYEIRDKHLPTCLDDIVKIVREEEFVDSMWWVLWLVDYLYRRDITLSDNDKFIDDLITTCIKPVHSGVIIYYISEISNTHYKDLLNKIKDNVTLCVDEGVEVLEYFKKTGDRTYYSKYSDSSCKLKGDCGVIMKWRVVTGRGVCYLSTDKQDYEEEDLHLHNEIDAGKMVLWGSNILYLTTRTHPTITSTGVSETQPM